MLPVLLSILLLLALATAVAPSRQARALGFLLAVPVGMVVYLLLGIGMARCLGVGRFYSLPLGAEHIADRDIVVSLAFWICCAGLVIQWMLRKRNRAA
jgi:hypothetical protein